MVYQRHSAVLGGDKPHGSSLCSLVPCTLGQEKQVPLEVSIRRKGMVGGLRPANTSSYHSPSYSALLAAEKLRGEGLLTPALLTLPFARHFLSSLSWMKPANI